MQKLDIFKGAVGFVVGAGVNHIVSGVVDSLVPQTNPYQKVVVFAGKMGIGMTTGAIVKKHVNSEIDEMADWYNKHVVKTPEV